MVSREGKDWLYSMPESLPDEEVVLIKSPMLYACMVVAMVHLVIVCNLIYRITGQQ